MTNQSDDKLSLSTVGKGRHSVCLSDDLYQPPSNGHGLSDWKKDSGRKAVSFDGLPVTKQNYDQHWTT